MENNDFCLNLYNYCLIIEPVVLKMLNMPKEQIDINIMNQYVSIIKDCLINLFKNENISFDTKDKKLEKIFSFVYDLIKMEIIVYNESTLYNFIKSKKIDSSYINNLIIEEINNLGNDSLEKKEIKKIISNLCIKNRKSDYFEIDIIKCLLMSKGKYNKKEDLKRQCQKEFFKFNNDKIEMEKVENRVIKIKDTLPELQDKLKIAKKEFKKNIIVMSLIGSVSISGILGGIFYVRKNSIRNCLTKTTNITSTDTGRNDTYQEDYLSDYKSCPDEKYVKVCEPWKNDNEGVSRKVKKYDISYLNLDNLRINPEICCETKSSSEIKNTDRYNKEIRELVDINYTYKDNKIDNELAKKYKRNLLITYVVIYGIYKISMIIDIGIKLEHLERLFLLVAPVSRIIDLLDSKKNLKNIPNELADANKKLQESIQELLYYINNNEKLKKKFEECLAENKEIFSDEESLITNIKEKIAVIEKTNQQTIKVLKKVKGF